MYDQLCLLIPVSQLITYHNACMQFLPQVKLFDSLATKLFLVQLRSVLQYPSSSNATQH